MEYLHNRMMASWGLWRILACAILDGEVEVLDLLGESLWSLRATLGLKSGFCCCQGLLDRLFNTVLGTYDCVGVWCWGF